MREIKFRGIEKYHFACDEDRPKTMLYGAGLIQDSVNTWLIDNPSRRSLALGMTKTIIEPDTVGQYTGLKDRNGQEVYEGDILKIPDHYEGDNHYAERYEEVKFIEGGFDVETCDITFYLCEIIGNIHENGDLLK